MDAEDGYTHRPGGPAVAWPPWRSGQAERGSCAESVELFASARAEAPQSVLPSLSRDGLCSIRSTWNINRRTN